MKPHLTLEAQLSLLMTNGLEVSDPDVFLIFLKQQNYYRFRGYFHPFLAEIDGKVTNQFKPQSTDQTIIELVEFDRMLRSLLFEACCSKLWLCLKANSAPFWRIAPLLMPKF